MRGAIVAFALVLTVLGAVPVEASLPGGDWNTEDGLLIFLSQLHRQIDGILAWMAGDADYSEAAFQSLAPIFDRAYSAQVLARRIDGLPTGRPRRVPEVVGGFAGPLPRVAL